MSFCEHCAGQRFDRAQVLRTLRATRKELREKGGPCDADAALVAAIDAVRMLDLPHLETVEESVEGQTVH